MASNLNKISSNSEQESVCSKERLSNNPFFKTLQRLEKFNKSINKAREAEVAAMAANINGFGKLTKSIAYNIKLLATEINRLISNPAPFENWGVMVGSLKEPPKKKDITSIESASLDLANTIALIDSLDNIDTLERVFGEDYWRFIDLDELDYEVEKLVIQTSVYVDRLIVKIFYKIYRSITFDIRTNTRKLIRFHFKSLDDEDVLMIYNIELIDYQSIANNYKLLNSFKHEKIIRSRYNKASARLKVESIIKGRSKSSASA